MSRSITLVSVILVMSVTTPNAEATRYVVEPVELSDGYAITGGYIETKTSGPLKAGDITDYQFILEGEVPHISIFGTVLATDGQILLPAVPDDATQRHWLTFSSDEPTHRDCERCYQSVTYSTGPDLIPIGNGRVRYGHYELVALHDNVFFAPTSYHLDQGSYVVATVPEPSTVMLIFLGVCVFATRRKRKA